MPCTPCTFVVVPFTFCGAGVGFVFPGGSGGDSGGEVPGFGLGAVVVVLVVVVGGST